MWPFKKKTLPRNIVTNAAETVICIPGDWNDWTEFILKVVDATSGEYIAAGNILMNAKKEKHFTIEFCQRDENMKKAFTYSGKVTSVTNEFLDKIGSHKHVLYISSPTGNLEDAGHISFAAEAVLKAGGIGVRIETAGKAFEKENWHTLIESYEEASLYEMFVLDSIMQEDGTVYSCGMHNLGYKDTIVSGEEFQEAVDLIKIFGYYQIVDKPTIQDKQTFSRSVEAPRYRIMDEHDQPNIGHELFENPFGMWRLKRE